MSELTIHNELLAWIDGDGAQGGDGAGRSGAEEEERGDSGEDEWTRKTVLRPVGEELVEGEEDQESGEQAAGDGDADRSSTRSYRHPFLVAAALPAFFRKGRENAPHCFRKALPFRSLGKEFSATLCRVPVEPGLAIVLRCPVLARDEPLLDESLQRRIKRAVPYLQHILRSEFDGLCNSVPMHRAESDRSQEQEVERA